MFDVHATLYVIRWSSSLTLIYSYTHTLILSIFYDLLSTKILIQAHKCVNKVCIIAWSVPVESSDVYVCICRISQFAETHSHNIVQFYCTFARQSIQYESQMVCYFHLNPIEFYWLTDSLCSSNYRLHNSHTFNYGLSSKCGTIGCLAHMWCGQMPLKLGRA